VSLTGFSQRRNAVGRLEPPDTQNSNRGLGSGSAVGLNRKTPKNLLFEKVKRNGVSKFVGNRHNDLAQSHRRVGRQHEFNLKFAAHVKLG
jgi:hypothetical protein